MNPARKVMLAVCALAASHAVLPNAALAQSADRVARQAAGLERIAGALGDWQSAPLRWDEKRGDWALASANAAVLRISFHRMGHGKAYRLTLDSPAYKVDGFLTYDVWTDRYVLVSLDDVIGQIDVQQGRFTDGQLVLDNLKADTTYEARSSTLHTRVALQFADAALVAIQVDSSPDRGQTWRPTSLYRVERTAPAD